MNLVEPRPLNRRERAALWVAIRALRGADRLMRWVAGE